MRTWISQAVQSTQEISTYTELQQLVTIIGENLQPMHRAEAFWGRQGSSSLWFPKHYFEY